MVKTSVETKTLQAWPRGTSYTYQGDPIGPKAQRRLKTDRSAKWRQGTPAERLDIRVNELATIYADRDVLACQSALITDLLNAGTIEGITYDDIVNIRIDAYTMDADACRAWIKENTSESIDADADLDDLRQIVDDNAQDAEIFEWWLVSPWLCMQLRAIGECVIDSGYGGQWWGRTCTGQGFIMDGTLQRIARNFVTLADVKGGK